MPTIKEILSAKPFPAFIKDHPIMSEYSEIKKVFPNIGLSNCSGDYSQTIKEEIATPILHKINETLSRRAEKLTQFIEKTPKEGKKISENRKNNGKIIIDACTAVSNMISSKKDLIKRSENGKMSLVLNGTIKLSDKFAFKKGESLFRVYNKIDKLCSENKFACLLKLENMQEFKNFSYENVPNGSKSIVFSSDGLDGAWDLATISMRGIESCQAWTGQYHDCLVGTVIDPFVGVIYLTEKGKKFNEYGSKMIRRSIVRFLVNKKTRKPVIYIDHMYPQFDQNTNDAFTAFLKKQVKGKFEIVSLGNYYDYNREFKTTDYYIPSSPIVDRLRLYSKGLLDHMQGQRSYDLNNDNYNYGVLSYKDTFIENKFKIKLRPKYLEILKNKKKLIAESAIGMTKLHSDYDELKPFIAKFNRTKLLREAIFSAIVRCIDSSLTDKDFKNSGQYIRSWCMNLLFSGDTLSKKLSEALPRISEKYALDFSSCDQSNLFASVYLKSLSTHLKDHVKGFIKK